MASDTHPAPDAVDSVVEADIPELHPSLEAEIEDLAAEVEAAIETEAHTRSDHAAARGGTLVSPAAVPGGAIESARTAGEDLMAYTLPVGPPPESVNEQRAWAELRKLQLETERSALELKILRRRELEGAADPGRAHVYTFYGSIEAESVQQCMAELGTWSRRDPGVPISIIFNSPGGSVHDGLALFDYIRQLRALGHHVTTIALGRAASMGAVLLQAGDHRVLGANAFVLVHEVSNASVGKVSELADGVEYTRRLQSRLLGILSERSTLTAREIQRRWARKEWWLASDEALALGLADEVV